MESRRKAMFQKLANREKLRNAELKAINPNSQKNKESVFTNLDKLYEAIKCPKRIPDKFHFCRCKDKTLNLGCYCEFAELTNKGGVEFLQFEYLRLLTKKRLIASHTVLDKWDRIVLNKFHWGNLSPKRQAVLNRFLLKHLSLITDIVNLSKNGVLNFTMP